MGKNKKQLIDEIVNLTGQLETESLEFLKAQASTLLYNQEVRKKNASTAAAKDKQRTKSGKEKAPSESTQPKVYIEQLKNKKYFDLCIRNSKLFMDSQEIKSMYKIAKAAGSSEEGAARLYRWLKKERSDVLVDGGIRNENSPTMKLIYQELLNSFSTS